MARTINEIYNEITDSFISISIIKVFYGLEDNKTFSDQFSPSSLEATLFYHVASAIWTLEKLFDLHRIEVNNIIGNLKPGTTRWYANMVRSFQFGFNLLPDSDQFDNTGRTDQEITQSKIVAHSAVVERDKKLIIKTAKSNGSDLEPLSKDEKTALDEFIERFRYAGVDVESISEKADQLKLALDIYYNPLVLNSQGHRLDGTSMTPVGDAVRAYLRILPFNGELVLAFLTDALQQVDGVVIPHVVSAWYKYGALDWLNISVKYQPYSGYLRIDDANLIINYIPQSEILQ
ncbi:nucleotidyltransferase [Dysgonomonas sp. ZJ709]|uniref:nucleotidyltransferase n=1 Tax=Dysgonomonas sp. ZJ709 TaxID=2709797 RepID=UPI0013EC4FF5|nr:nucleotidyltransferase [Dysgonomonas sp. ZJ709]